MPSLKERFQHLRLSTRLLIGFAIPVALLTANGVSGSRAIHTTQQGLETVYRDRVVPLRGLKVIADAYAVDVIDATNKCNAGLISPEQANAAVGHARESIRTEWEQYLGTQLTPEERRLGQEADALFRTADEHVNRLQETLSGLQGDCTGRLADFDGALYASIDPISGKVAELIELQLREAKTQYVDAEQRYTSTLRWTVALIAFSALLCVAVGVLIARAIIRQLGGEPAYAAQVVRAIARGDLGQAVQVRAPDSLLADMDAMQGRLREFMTAQSALAEEHETGDMDARMQATAFPGAFGQMALAVNGVIDNQVGVNRRVIGLLSEYAVGDLHGDMPELPGKMAVISHTMATAKSNLQAINAEIQRLVDAAARGDFGARGDEAAFQHAFRDMVRGLNSLMQEADGGLSDVGGMLDALAAGDLTRRLDRQYHGAFERLAGSANATAAQWSSLVAHIHQTSEAVSTAASEIAAGNDDLARRTEQQAASLEETASSMEELSSTVRHNAENAREANDLALGASGVARRAGEVMGQVVASMQAIETSSRRIEDIISLIDSIAFQTNILALNAAVEAARAGEQGRGFTVVASEVRGLAQRAATAAQEIKALIETSVQDVVGCTQLVGEASGTLREVVGSVEQMASRMGEISLATREQSQGIEQVNKTVGHIDQSTQQNAALVEEATAASRALDEQAQQLLQMVGSFRFEDAPLQAAA